MTQYREFAAAKINLALHVTGLRPSGYHLLDSLVVFAEVGDTVTATQAAQLSLTISGPQAATLPVTDDNLVLRAARAMGFNAAIELEKHLPIASGIGGGSADAAATLRALARLSGHALPDAAAVLSLGADVPVCLAGKPARMQGVGELLSAVPPLPRLYVVLVNPGVTVSTPAVFNLLQRKDNPAMAEVPQCDGAVAFADWLSAQRNDLEAAALALAPPIGEAKALLAAQHNCLLARMSGSGATCFGLFAEQKTAVQAQQAIALARPNWWCSTGAIRE